ncbi:MAG: hypothetical protein AAFR42_09160 [Cyanobacteria bacterium J06628_6]
MDIGLGLAASFLIWLLSVLRGVVLWWSLGVRWWGQGLFPTRSICIWCRCATGFGLGGAILRWGYRPVRDKL